MTAPLSSGTRISAPRGWKRVLFIVIVFVLVLAVAEGLSVLYLRRFQGYDGHHLNKYVFDPYKDLLPAPGYVDTRGVHHNSVGFRRRTEVELRKPDDVYRIFLMGASTAYGEGGLWEHIEPNYPILKDQETIDAYLERKLNALGLGKRVEVINAAIVGTWTHHHLIYLNQRILRYQPDMILFMEGYNDFFRFERGFNSFDNYFYNTPHKIILGEPTIHSLAYANGRWLFRRWALFNVLGHAGRLAKLVVAPRPERRTLNPDSVLAALRVAFPENALALQRRSGLILRDAGVKTYFMLQPMLILERNRPGLTDIERRLLDFNVESYWIGYEQYMHRAVDYVRAEESAMAAAVGAEFLDLTGIYRDASGQMFTDYAHLTPRANEIMAEVLAARLAPDIRTQAIVAKETPRALPSP